jgi:hypothetical protein
MPRQCCWLPCTLSWIITQEYFVDFCFCFLLLSKVDRKISVSIGLIQNFEILDFAMAKVEKVNIAVTYG